jgi:hypothetical protein
MSYKGPGVSNISRLIYPCPSQNIDHLGTHLVSRYAQMTTQRVRVTLGYGQRVQLHTDEHFQTIDLDGNIKFGPDVEPIGSPSDVLANPDFWQAHLAPSEAHLQSIGEAAQRYLPGIDPSRLTPDYAGIRPNISPPGAGFSDFMIRHKPERRGLVEMMGFNSPGLTSALAAGEMVSGMVRRDVWGEKGDLEGLAVGWE